MSSSLHLSQIRKWFLQSPPAEWAVQHVRELLLGAMRQGAVPQHVAFVMDGNRRFARSHQIEPIEGHNLGFEALAKILEVCYKIGVKVVTIYAFSIENFKRTKYEVDALMDMAKVKLSQLAQHGELLERYGARMEFLGQKEMVRPDVLDAIENAIKMTSGNSRAVLNICAPYTSRDEITTAIRNTVVDYTKPIQNSTKRPFSESHIARNIRARQLGTVTEGDEDAHNDFARLDDEEWNYTPSNPESKAAFDRIVSIATENIRSSQEDDVSFANSFGRKAGCLILERLKNPSLDEDEKKEAVTATLGYISSTAFAELLSLAERIQDWSPQPDLGSSASTTLYLSSSDPPSAPAAPPVNYPDPETITADVLTAHTFTGAHTPPLDLLIRTSGVERLSDFMLWQCHETTEIVFLECMWPEFDLWHFMPVLLEWQWRRRKESQEQRKRGRSKLD
ncbi:Di-trans-poly-cis-decaprenylcistransferase [Trichodelitschia bisporula]|uniref:Di-trans-poly-cis-decaprenylcistransferase n=1 Tax=Trichodelitschia bisporula TaxID=703511 RepID=A0A6G1HYB6_9PEZI|nr:Di-trans-poly-cis-decaprenylcistransferase [Trichodelitschia bisporula]